MKIIISPSKTQKLARSSKLSDQSLIFPKKHNELQRRLIKLSKKELKKIMKIDKTLLDKTYNNIQNNANLPTFHAFESFNGLVFKGLNKEQYQIEEYDYIQKNIIILDAFYGILNPGTLIKSYRLDMKMKIGVNLYSFWDINGYFFDELIINLASNEFSKMITSKNIINISFLQYKNNSYVNQATFSKQARGQFLNYLILNQIVNINKMTQFNGNNYSYNTILSNEFNIVFTRNL
ncbi:MAG: YaaA family protein [Candidatus Izimaplasma sp.]|nr:YaaA family protein [Candidatus Izimaplasma bacterium]